LTLRFDAAAYEAAGAVAVVQEDQTSRAGFALVDTRDWCGAGEGEDSDGGKNGEECFAGHCDCGIKDLKIKFFLKSFEDRRIRKY
jgi:hypothetical protein